jgi:uncharacterized protein YggE
MVGSNIAPRAGEPACAGGGGVMRALGLVLLTGLAACAEPADPRGVGRKETLLQVAATGRSEARPDEARFTVGVSTMAASAAAASTGNNATMTRVMSGLAQLGIPADDVQTRALTLSRIDYGPERGRFRAENLVEVRVRKLDAAGPAIAAATEAGGNVISGPDLRVSDPERTDNAAYAAAYRAARARAEAYAEAAGLRVVRVLAVRDEGAALGPIGYGRATAETASAPRPVSPPPVEPGVNRREVQVRADFALAK